jgi:hypothetical protein
MSSEFSTLLKLLSFKKLQNTVEETRHHGGHELENPDYISLQNEIRNISIIFIHPALQGVPENTFRP